MCLEFQDHGKIDSWTLMAWGREVIFQDGNRKVVAFITQLLTFKHRGDGSTDREEKRIGPKLPFVIVICLKPLR